MTGSFFAPYAESWLDGCEARGLKHTTHRAYKVILETHLKPAFGNKHLSEIDRKAVRAFAMKKRDTVITRTTKKNPGPEVPAKAPRKPQSAPCSISSAASLRSSTRRSKMDWCSTTRP
ncbi:MAG: hypothetical protein H7Y39_04220 [Nitrospiraceae bacterium]|nr:hypothetical protein [Nitrospiraceae bacterium]